MEDDEEERLHQKKLNELLNSLNQKDKIVELNKDNFQEFIKTHEISVIDFWSPWCAPCHILSPLVEDLSKKYPGLPFLRTSVDHGTAFDIAGKNMASYISMMEAIIKAEKYGILYKGNYMSLKQEISEVIK